MFPRKLVFLCGKPGGEWWSPWSSSKGEVSSLLIGCPFCGKGEESLTRILIHCPLIWDLWAVIFSTLGAVGMRPFLVQDFLNSWVNFQARKNLRILWKVVPPCLFLGYLEG